MKGIQSFFLFTFYIGVLIEGALYTLVCAVYELVSGQISLISALLAILLVLILLGFAVFIPYHYFKYRNQKEVNLKETKMKLLYEDLKLSKWTSGLFYLWFLIRRFLMILIFFALSDVNHWLKYSIFALLQIAHFFYIVICRPFTDWTINLLEALNEVTFIVFIILTMILNSFDSWKLALLDTCLWFLVIMGLQGQLIVLLITLILALVSLWKWCKGRKMRQIKKNARANFSKIDDTPKQKRNKNRTEANEIPTNDGLIKTKSMLK